MNVNIMDAERLPIRKQMRSDSQGSVMLAGLMAVSFATFIFLGIISITMGDRVGADHAIQGSRALQLAHSGIEYVLWEMNYGGGDFVGGQWGNPNDPNIFEATFNNVGPNQDDTLTVIVNQNADPWVIESDGTARSINRIVEVTIPDPGGGPGEPGLFDHMFYTRQDMLYLGPGVSMDCWDSSAQGTCAQTTIIRSDYIPLRSQGWESLTGSQRKNAAAIVIDDNAWLGGDAKLELREPTSGEYDPQNPPPGKEQPGYTLYPVDVGKTEAERLADHGIASCVAQGEGACTQPAGSESLSYAAKTDGSIPGTDGWPIDDYDLQVCPGDVRYPTEIYMEYETLVLGCPDQAYCDTYCFGANPDDKITIYTGDEFGSWYFWGPVTTTGAGQIEVYSPTDIYYTDMFGTGLDIGGGGIINMINNGNPDPTKLAFYRNDCDGCWGGFGYDNIFSTSTAFHGAIYDSDGRIKFQNGATPLDFYGALNVEKIDTENSVVNFYWDRILETAYPGTGGGGSCTPADPVNNPCKPNPGSWTFK